MSYTKQSLQNLYSLSSEDTDAILTACQLPLDRQEYSEEEKIAFEKQLELAKAQFKDFFDLLSGARESGMLLTRSEIMKILSACNLADQEQYTLAEYHLFIEACRLVKEQGLAYNELSEYLDIQPKHNLESDIEVAAQALQTSGQNLIEQVVRTKAKADAGAVGSLYLQHLANEFASPEFQQAWQQMEEALKSRIEGKSRRPTQLSGPTTLPSTTPLNSLPPTSDNSSATE